MDFGADPMTEPMAVMSWNIKGEVGITDERMERQIEFLDTHTTGIDIHLFQAVNYERTEGGWDGQLGTLLEYFGSRDYHVTHTGDWARELAESTIQPHADIESPHNRCNLIASRWPIERQPLSLRNRGNRKPWNLDYYYSHFPQKLLVGEIDLSNDATVVADELEVWNVAIINGSNWGEEKLNMLETVYSRVGLQTSKTERPILLGGDFNAPKRETASQEIVPHGTGKGKYTNYPDYGDPHYYRDGTGEKEEYTFEQRWKRAEARLFDSDIGSWGMTDAYWAAEQSQKLPSTEDFTHIVHSGTPSRKRLDHILVSDQFEVRRCELWNGHESSVDGLADSDHAPVVARLSIGE